MGALSWLAWTYLGLGVVNLLYVPFLLMGIRPWVDLVGSDGAGWLFLLTGLPAAAFLGNIVIRRRTRQAILRDWQRTQTSSG